MYYGWDVKGRGRRADDVPFCVRRRFFRQLSGRPAADVLPILAQPIGVSATCRSLDPLAYLN